MYYIYKQGVYGHGVFWIGESLEEGMLLADSYASADEDDYHDWELYEHSGTRYGSRLSEDKPVYRGMRK